MTTDFQQQNPLSTVRHPHLPPSAHPSMTTQQATWWRNHSHLPACLAGLLLQLQPQHAPYAAITVAGIGRDADLIAIDADKQVAQEVLGQVLAVIDAAVVPHKLVARHLFLDLQQAGGHTSVTDNAAGGFIVAADAPIMGAVQAQWRVLA